MYIIEDQDQKNYLDFCFDCALDALEVVEALEAKTGRAYFVTAVTRLNNIETEALINSIKRGRNLNL